MAFDNGNSHQSQKTLSEINVVPLVDVMLVLLIIFIITAPLISVDGEYVWNGETVMPELLAARFIQSVANSPQTELHNQSRSIIQST